MTLGQLIDQLDTVRERKRKLSEQIKTLEGEYSVLEEQVKERLLAEGMDKATGKKATASLTQEVVATVKDWDALCAYVKKSGHFHLLQRRVSNPAFRELAAKKPVPGLEPFVKTNLNLAHLKGKS